MAGDQDAIYVDVVPRETDPPSCAHLGKNADRRVTVAKDPGRSRQVSIGGDMVKVVFFQGFSGQRNARNLVWGNGFGLQSRKKPKQKTARELYAGQMSSRGVWGGRHSPKNGDSTWGAYS
jgi:hypothetical protein